MFCSNTVTVPRQTYNSLPQVLRQASEGVFVPLTVGGGIRGFTDGQGKKWSALEVAAEYFRSGADKVSIGGDAVFAAEEYRRTGKKTGTSSIEQISWVGPKPWAELLYHDCSIKTVEGLLLPPVCKMCTVLRFVVACLVCGKKTETSSVEQISWVGPRLSTCPMTAAQTSVVGLLLKSV